MNITTLFRILHRSRNGLLVALFCFSVSQCTFIREATKPADIPAEKDSAGSESRLRQRILDYAQTHLGADYRAAGKSPKSGFDCSGFTSYVFNKFDIALAASSSGQAGQGKPVAPDKVKPGDLVFFRRSKGQEIFHVAMVVSAGEKSLKVIHSTSRGVVIDDIYADKYWKPKIDSARDVVSKGK
jgi:cell wall-associated NlpC family hydrolase